MFWHRLVSLEESFTDVQTAASHATTLQSTTHNHHAQYLHCTCPRAGCCSALPIMSHSMQSTQNSIAGPRRPRPADSDEAEQGPRPPHPRLHMGSRVQQGPIIFPPEGGVAPLPQPQPQPQQQQQQQQRLQQPRQQRIPAWKMPCVDTAVMQRVLAALRSGDCLPRSLCSVAISNVRPALVCVECGRYTCKVTCPHRWANFTSLPVYGMHGIQEHRGFLSFMFNQHGLYAEAWQH